MDAVSSADYFKRIAESVDDTALPIVIRQSVQDILSYCRELKTEKTAARFVASLQNQFVFEMLLELLELLLLEETLEKRNAVAQEMDEQATCDAEPERTVPTKAFNKQEYTWKPFYLDGHNRRQSRQNAEGKCIRRTNKTMLGGRMVQLWHGLVDVCTAMNVQAVYFDEMKKYIMDARFAAIVERWLHNPTEEHILSHQDTCAALVGLLVTLHNHPFFDATCFLQPTTPNSVCIQLCLSSFFDVFATMGKTQELAEKFLQWVLEIKVVRQDQPLPQPTGDYEATMERVKFATYPYGVEYFSRVKQKHPSLKLDLMKGCMRRLAQEIDAFNDNLPVHADSMIAVRVDEDHPQYMSVLITGPRNTPYDSGCFVFNMIVPGNYPQTPPAMLFLTTGGGSVRFSPNLYECGKVCLSLLGTWEGDPWNPMTSTLLQLLVSIQGAILGAEFPYYNEPGREREWGTREATRAQRVDENGGLEPLREGTIEFAWTGAMTSPPLGFDMLVREHFWLKRKHILDTMALWLEDAKNSDSEGYYNRLSQRAHECMDALSSIATARADDDELRAFKADLDALRRRFR